LGERQEELADDLFHKGESGIGVGSTQSLSFFEDFVQGLRPLLHLVFEIFLPEFAEEGDQVNKGGSLVQRSWQLGLLEIEGICVLISVLVR